MLRPNRKITATRQPANGRSKANSNSLLLASAAADGDVAGLRKLIELAGDVNYQNREGETPLTFAAAWNQLEAAELLLSFGADPNVADKTGGTALMLAVQHGSKELVGLLLRHGANAKAKDNFGNTVLQHADWRQDGDGAAVRKLLLSRSGQRLPARIRKTVTE